MRVCGQCGARVEVGVRVCTSCHALMPLDATEGVFLKGATILRASSRIVLDKKLGEGGMAIVWRAWEFFAPNDPRAAQPRLCALKIMRGARGSLDELRDYFTREADALGRLSHPNIVTLHECFEHEGRVMLSLEYVEGETLDSLIARQVARATLAGPGALPGLPLLRAWHYFQQLLGALAAAHAIGLVHRDVKPQNVLLRADGVVKLTDFGIATRSTSQVGQSNAVGTGAFMSPEQVLSKAVDGRSDLYSAAIVLYMMLSGRLPFPTTDRSEFAVRQDQVEKVPPPLRTWLPQAPAVIDALFSRALAKDPAARFADAIELGSAFRAGLGLPDSEEWRAQAEIAQGARGGTARMPELKERDQTLRELLVARYQTAPMPVRR